MKEEAQYQVFDVKSLKVFPEELSNEILRVPGFVQSRKKGREEFNPSQTHLNFEISSGQIVPVNVKWSIPKRIKESLEKRNIANPNEGTDSPTRRTAALFMFSGSRAAMRRLAFDTQRVPWKHEDDKSFWDNSGVIRQKKIEDWAIDIYQFMVGKYGKDNVIAFVVHIDEINPDAHCIVLPVSTEKKISWSWMFAGESKWTYRNYMIQLNDELEKVYKPYGMRRGERNKYPINSTPITELEREILEKECEACQARLIPLIEERDNIERERKRHNTIVKSMTTMKNNLEEELTRTAQSMRMELNQKILKKNEIKNTEEKKLKELQEQKDKINQQIDNLKRRMKVLEKRKVEESDIQSNTLRKMEHIAWMLLTVDIKERSEKVKRLEIGLKDNQQPLYNEVFKKVFSFKNAELGDLLIDVAVALFLDQPEYANKILSENGYPLFEPDDNTIRQEGEDDEHWRIRCLKTAFHLVNPDFKGDI